MKKLGEIERLKGEYQKIEVPEEGVAKMEQSICQAKKDKQKAKKRRRIQKIGTGFAAVLLVLFILINANEPIAYAMCNMPVLGKVFDVIIIREYNWNSENKKKNVAIKIPEIVNNSDKSASIAQVNKSIKDYTDELLTQFYKELQLEEGYQDLSITYNIVTDSDKWFSLDIIATKVQASGYEFHKYFTIDKETDRVIELQDLFQKDADYRKVISEEIIRQMKESEDTVYFTDKEKEGFVSIKEDQNFYLEEDGTLVIAFDEYEVGPGYIGAPKFKIPHEVIKDILR